MTDSFIVNCGTHKHPSLKMSLVMNTKRRRSLLLLSRRCGALNTGVMSGMDPLPSLPLCNATPQPTDFKEESLRHRLFTLSRTGTHAHVRRPRSGCCSASPMWDVLLCVFQCRATELLPVLLSYYHIKALYLYSSAA